MENFGLSRLPILWRKLRRGRRISNALLFRADRRNNKNLPPGKEHVRALRSAAAPDKNHDKIMITSR